MTPQDALKRWHEMAASRDLSKVGEIAREDVLFRSPVAHTPYHGREALTLVLSTVIKVFQDFTYHRQFVSEDGMSVALEFSAHVGGKQLKGADFIRFDENGLISEFEVMIRPASGLMALGQAMGAALDGKMHILRGAK
ncbi:nuclear transport factor 2 family protein [Marinicaulis aureus]|uniref:Nuclear transport factor 2 family protein n=1 Tax=Hyphococcus aureus TaxID=2666033 RepID=A0ABW1L0Q3_9PROT